FLEALENEEWSKLPGGVFNRGFVRAIARYLGLSEEHLLSEYDLAHRDYEVAQPAAAPNPIPLPPKWLIGLAALVILLALAGAIPGGVYEWRRYAALRAAKRAQASSLQVTSSSPSALPNLMPQAVAAVPANPLDLALSTSTGTHVRIVADGTLLADE